VPILAGGLDQARTTALQEAALSSCRVSASGRTAITRLVLFSSGIATAFFESRSSSSPGSLLGEVVEDGVLTPDGPLPRAAHTPLNKR
jgi:hypothetical protein